MKTLTFKTHNNSNVQAKLLTKFESENGVEIEFEAEPNDFAPDYDESIMDSFQKTLDNDNDYQYCGVSHNWFCAKVTVRYKDFEATEYLGGCSYTSYKEFKSDNYFFDVISTCVDQINYEIKAKNEMTIKRWKTRSLLRLANDLGYLVVPKTAVLS